MSFQSAIEPSCTASDGAVELLVEGRAKDLGGFSVRRVLPSRDRKMVGPFVFFDQMGPAEFPPGEGIAVRPHPHIGLATITYLFEGELMHRDSLGYAQPIQARAVNLMTAGRGIVHSERAGSDLQSRARLHGIQSWMALPDEKAEIEPAFAHYPADELPEFEHEGVNIRLIMGDAFGRTSPVLSHSPTLYMECRLPVGSTFTLPPAAEVAAFVVDGKINIGDASYNPGIMAIACPGETVTLHADEDSHIMVIGGDPVGERRLWWNFVGNFTAVPGETEFIPLPEFS